MWIYWPAVLGFVIVAFTLREVYQDLFHPSATGSLSDFVASTTFNLFRHVPGFLSNAGPLAIVLVIFIWAVSVCVGFALIYWAMPPEYFKIEAGRPQTGFLPMVYFSLEVLTTLGLGDYAPVPIWLRLIVTFEALVGFGVLTASVSSIILVHSALARVRTLARRVSTLIRAEDEMKFSFHGDDAQQMLADFSAGVIRTRVDLIQFPVVYYFYSDQDHASLPQGLPYLVRLADAGLAQQNKEATRRSAALLRISLRDLADALRGRFVTSASHDCEAVFEAYARHHDYASPG
jgi:ion channel